MEVKDTIFAQKIMSYSKPTMEKISHFTTTRNRLHLLHQIVIESKTEQEVVEKLNKLEKNTK